MKLSKRIFAVVLASILALSVFAVSASAVDGAMNFQVKADSSTYQVGDTVTVNVYISDNYNATCLRFPVLYNSDVFELPTGGNIKLTAYGDCLTYKGSLEANTSNDGSYIPAEYDSSAYGAILVQWTASVSSTNIGCFRSESAVKCFSFQLKVKSSAGGKAGTVFIPSESDLFYNQAVTDVTNATTICRVNTSLTFNPLNITVDKGETDGITTYPGSDVIIDYDNKVIKNWSEGITSANIKSNVMPTGNATLTYMPSEGESGTWGTGAKVKVWSNGLLVDEYTILIYGDVNGNAIVDASDVAIIEDIAAGYSDPQEGVFATAGDLDQSGDVDVSDSFVLNDALGGYSDLDQTM